MKATDLVVLDELKGAVRAHTPAEYDALKAEIRKSGVIHDPILWARLHGGAEVVVDGHTRLEIFDELNEEDLSIMLSDPRAAEIVSLRDGTVLEAVAWIRTHQASRRNDESLAGLYLIGKEFIETDATSAAIAEKHGITPSQVRHAGKVAENLDAAEEMEPGTKDAILDSNANKTFVRDATPEDIVNRARTGAAPERPRGPLEGFRPLTRSVANANAQLKAASRAANDLQNEQTSNEWSDECVSLLKDAHAAVDALQKAVEQWIKGSV